MSQAYEKIIQSIETYCSTSGANQELANKLKNTGLTMSIDELYNLNTSISHQLTAFKFFFYFLKYLREAPKGKSYSVLHEYFNYTIQSIPQEIKSVVNPFLSEIYLGALIKEVQSVENTMDLIPWLDVYGHLKRSGNSIQAYEDALANRISSKLWDVIGEEEKNIRKCIEFIRVMISAKKNEFHLGDHVYTMISSIFGYLNVKYEMYDGNPKRNIFEVRKLVGYLRSLNPEGEMEKFHLNQMAEFFGYENPPVEEQADYYVDDEQEKEWKLDPNLPISLINFNTFTFIGNIYTNNYASVEIRRYRCSQFGDVALKIYTLNPGVDENRINNEIGILQTLTNNASQYSSFLKFYGIYREKNQVYIAMEYIEKTLMVQITNMKINGHSFNEQHFEYYARQLLSAFAFMETLGIYHQDIKPHNILVASDWTLKIIDFSVSASKSYDEGADSPTGIHPIQGTHGYMAPELQKHAIASGQAKKEIKYRRGKADVFSLGLVFLQMYTLDVLHMLNLEENNRQLLEKVDQVQIDWLRTLLKSMLQLNYNERKSFRECLSFVPGGNTIN